MKKSLFALPVIGLGLIALASCQGNTGDDLSRGRSDLTYFADDETGLLEHYKANFTDESNSVLLSTVSKEAKAEKEALKKKFDLEPTTSVETTTTSVETTTTSEEVTTTSSVTTTDEDGDSWYKIYLNTEYKSSLIRRKLSTINYKDEEIAIASFFEEYDDHIKTFTVSNLTFTDLIYSSEYSSIIAKLYDKEEGLGNLTLGNFETNTTEAWNKNISFEYARQYHNANENKEMSLEIVYLPTFVVRKYNNIIVLKTYIYVPVYTAFTVDGNEIIQDENGNISAVSSSIADINTVDFHFDSLGHLVAKEINHDVTTSTSGDATENTTNANKNNSTVVFWIILGSILGVAAVGGVIVFIIFKKKK